MAKPKKKVIEGNINFSLSLNDKKNEYKVSNVLTAFRALKLEPEEIKTRALFELTKDGRTYRKILYVSQFRRFLSSDLHQRLLAKFFGKALQLAPNLYE